MPTKFAWRKQTLDWVRLPSRRRWFAHVLIFALQRGLGYERKWKLAYIRLNSQTPCPPSRMRDDHPGYDAKKENKFYLATRIVYRTVAQIRETK
jgi:hypothetical protein